MVLDGEAEGAPAGAGGGLHKVKGGDLKEQNCHGLFKGSPYAGGDAITRQKISHLIFALLLRLFSFLFAQNGLTIRHLRGIGSIF